MSGLLALADAESRRFGLCVARGRATAADAAALVDEMLALAVDVAIVRVDATDDAAAQAFAAHGLSPLHADGLVTWGIDLAPDALAPAAVAVGTLRDARSDDAAAIERLVATVFRDYPNHYRANPWFDPAGALAGYAEWALAHIGRADRTCWVHEVEGRVVGLACAALDAASGVASGNLHGVDPAHARRGIYRAMIRATLAHYAAQGARSFSIATQVGNLAVQRAWAGLGLSPRRCEQTFHLSLLFGHALAAPAVAGAPGDAARALLDGHVRACGDAALANARVHVRTGAVAAATLRSARIARRDGRVAATTLAQDGAGRVVGWAASDPIP